MHPERPPDRMIWSKDVDARYKCKYIHAGYMHLLTVVELLTGWMMIYEIIGEQLNIDISVNSSCALHVLAVLGDSARPVVSPTVKHQSLAHVTGKSGICMNAPRAPRSLCAHSDGHVNKNNYALNHPLPAVSRHNEARSWRAETAKEPAIYISTQVTARFVPIRHRSIPILRVHCPVQLNIGSSLLRHPDFG
jgi:hypothetical protein